MTVSSRTDTSEFERLRGERDLYRRLLELGGQTDLTTFLRDSTQIVSQLAISAASLAVINANGTR